MLKKTIFTATKGQALVEYSLILVIVSMAVIAVLMVFGERISAVFDEVLASLEASGVEVTWVDDEVPPTSPILSDFRSRIMDYYNDHGRWPHSTGSRRYTDLGLDPSDWRGPVEGVYWRPSGNKVGLKNVRGDNIQIYVDDLDGNTLQLYDGWNIWCPADETVCYYHTIAPGNEVDIDTLQVVEE